jgi:predicted DNA-binding protein
MKNKGDVATEAIHFRISKSTFYKLQKMAEQDKRPLSGYVRKVLEEHTENGNNVST